MANVTSAVYVTYLEKEGPYIKIWGQTDRSLPIAIEKALQQMTPQFEEGMFLPGVENFQVGLMCCAKFKDGSYYRARITNVSYLVQGMVEVLFIDYGNRDMVPCVNTRTMASLSAGLISIPPQARDFILAGVTLHGWDLSNFEIISNELRYLEFQMIPVLEVGPFLLVSLFSNKQDITINLLNRGLVLSIPVQMQQLTIQSLIERTSPSGLSISVPPPGLPMPTVQPKMSSVPQAVSVIPATQPPPTILTYKAMPLEFDSDYEVYVSYVSDGPCLFSVQLKKLEDQLKRLMTEINCIDLQQLDEYPLPGTVCLAQSSEDGYICRAVVTSMVDGKYKVFYVDFGNTELLTFDKLFQIPFKYIIPKVMATRFALAGVEQSTVSIEIKCAFKEFVNNKLLFMRVKPASSKSAISQCDLWDANGKRAVDMIKQAALQSYSEPVLVCRGFNQDVKVSFVYSCNRFYVQLKSKELELSQLMDKLQEVCASALSLKANQIKNGNPCYCLYEGDGLWYRAQIISSEGGLCKVRYVDYGNEELVMLETLREPRSELILALRPQAVECCLNGYQNMEANEQRDSLLEELILEQHFTMKVMEMQEGRALVDLFDTNHYNVASLLLDKIASVTSQISPLLVQDDYRIEHRKRTSPPQQQTYPRDRKPSRDFIDKNQEIKHDNWRQNKTSRSDERRDETNGFDKRDSFRQAINSNNDQWDKPNHIEKQIPFHQSNSRNDGQLWDKPNNTETRDSYQRTNNRNENQQFDKPNTFDKRESFQRSNYRSDNPQREKFAKRDSFLGGNNRNQDFQKPRRNGEDFQQKKFNKFNKSFNDYGGDGDGFKPNRRNDFKREGSEKSYSDSSEKSWKKPVAKSYSKMRSENRDREFAQPAPPISVNANEDNWGDGRATAELHVAELASEDAKFGVLENIAGCTEAVSVCWFYNPVNFYCQLEKHKDGFRNMMEEIQTKYTSRKTIVPVTGQSVIAHFQEDGALYRAEVLEVQFNKYTVRYVDYGNVATVNRIYAIDAKYMELPMQAVNCGLSAIGPSGESWPEPDAFSAYFDRNIFECQFVAFADNRYLVELIHEGARVSMLLLEVSLAISIQPNIDLDTALLCGQQLVVVMQHVASLREITVALESELTVCATMHNLDTATETFEDSLKQYVGHYVIMYVDDVNEAGLEVTLYDLTGQKLQIISPDEGAYDTVDPLCALPIYTQILQGWVSHATANSLYVQPSRFAETIAQLLESLYNHYETTVLEEPLKPEVGSLYAVQSADTNWYRGRVTEIDENSVVVIYVDYGNSESVVLTELRTLHPKFYQPHMLATEVLISGDGESYVEQEVIVSLSVGENGWDGEILSPLAAQEENNDEQLIPVYADLSNEVTVQSCALTVTEEVSSREEPDVQEALPLISSIETHIGVPVLLSHVDSPGEFYLQLLEAVEAIDVLQQSLQEQIPNLSDLENPTPGVLCAAPYSVHQQWYRAQVLDADDDITTVRFVDFGNTDVISNATTAIKTLPSDLLTVEQHARLCSLYVKPIGSEWSGEVFDKFEEYTNAEFLSAEIIRQDEKTTYVELYANGENVAELLKRGGLAAELQMETESSSTGFISHLNSPSEFWIQLESSVSDLEWVAEQLSTANNYPVLEDLTPGSLCAAVFPGDDSWYRARILSNTVAGLEVIFVDYGNSCSCSTVRELPEDLVMLPALAHKCSLQKPPGILQWSQAAGEKFKEISADGATVFNVNILTPGETSIVQLTFENEDISSQLLPERTECVVSHVDSLDKVWIRRNEDVEKLDAMSQAMLEADTWPVLTDVEENNLVAALYHDGLWYRARVTAKTSEAYTVVLIDYGKTGETKTVRRLDVGCEKEEPLAFHYRLEPLPRTKWAHDSKEKLEELSAEGTTVFYMELALENQIRLYLNGRDVRSDIGVVKCTPSASKQNTPKKNRDLQASSDILNDTMKDIVLVSSESQCRVELVEEDKLISEEPTSEKNIGDRQTLEENEKAVLDMYSVNENKEEAVANSENVTKYTDEHRSSIAPDKLDETVDGVAEPQLLECKAVDTDKPDPDVTIVAKTSSEKDVVGVNEDLKDTLYKPIECEEEKIPDTNRSSNNPNCNETSATAVDDTSITETLKPEQTEEVTVQSVTTPSTSVSESCPSINKNKVTFEPRTLSKPQATNEIVEWSPILNMSYESVSSKFNETGGSSDVEYLDAKDSTLESFKSPETENVVGIAEQKEGVVEGAGKTDETSSSTSTPEQSVCKSDESDSNSGALQTETGELLQGDLGKTASNDAHDLTKKTDETSNSTPQQSNLNEHETPQRSSERNTDCVDETESSLSVSRLDTREVSCVADTEINSQTFQEIDEFKEDEANSRGKQTVKEDEITNDKAENADSGVRKEVDATKQATSLDVDDISVRVGSNVETADSSSHDKKVRSVNEGGAGNYDELREHSCEKDKESRLEASSEEVNEKKSSPERSKTCGMNENEESGK